MRRPVSIESTCFRQVEFAGVLRGTDHATEARKLVDFLISATLPERVAAEPVRLSGPYRCNAASRVHQVRCRCRTPVHDRPGRHRRQPATVARRVDHHRAALNRPPRWFIAVVAAAPMLFITTFYAWPVATLLWTTLRHATNGRSPFGDLGGIIWFTVWQALASTVLTLVVGMLPAYVVARYSFRGRRLMMAATTVPFVLPTVVVGAAFLALLPNSWHGTAQAMIVAHVFFNIAVVVRLVGSMIAVIPHDLVGAARTLGASPARAARLIMMPLLRPALWSAAAVIFLFSFTSFGVAKLLGGPTNPTLEVEIARRATQLGDVSGAAALSAVQLGLLAVVIVWTSRRQRRTAIELNGATSPLRPRGRRTASARRLGRRSGRSRSSVHHSSPWSAGRSRLATDGRCRRGASSAKPKHGPAPGSVWIRSRQLAHRCASQSWQR